MDKQRVYFVSGIDTNVGKSYVTGELARRWRERGESVITQKFVQTGCGDDCGAMSEDIALHRSIMGTGLLACDLDGTTCPIRLPYPASPDLAARMEGVEIDLDAITLATQTLLQTFDTVLLEGAGGLLVPVRGEQTVLDYVCNHRLPLILVTSPRLGSINHTLLSLEVCTNRGVDVAMVAYNNYPETSPEITADTRDYLVGYLAKHHPHTQFLEIPYIETEL